MAQPCAAAAGCRDDFNTWISPAGVLPRQIHAERNVPRQIDFVDDHQFGAPENSRLLERLVFAPSAAQHHHLGILAQVVTGGTNMVGQTWWDKHGGTYMVG